MANNASASSTPQPPASLQPMASFAFWHLARGWSALAVQQRMYEVSTKRGWVDSKINDAIAVAIKSLSATRTAQDYLDGLLRAAKHHKLTELDK